jgi:cell division protein ZipA
MDRDTLRIVLLVIGLFFIAGIYVWGRHKQKLMDFLQRRGEYDELGYDQDAAPAAASAPLFEEPEADEYEGLGLKDRKPGPAEAPKAPAYGFDDELGEDLFAKPEPPAPKPEPPAAKPAPAAAKSTPEPEPPKKSAGLGAPILIQVSVVAAGKDRQFQGEELKDALLDLDLIHGSMGIFHRYDSKYRESLFSIASLVEPGTFPMEDMESFECPGVILFFQPDQVANPLAVYDDLIRTCHKLANRLGGVEWDDKRQPLSRDTIARMRAQLEDACEEL